MARHKTVRLETPAELAQWIDGFGSLGREIRAPALTAWQIATETFFGRTQEYVHILSGDLLASGSHRVFAFDSGGRIIGEVKYGGGKVAYALIEEHRGGDHAYLSRGWEATQAQFAISLPNAYRTVLNSWRRGR